MTETDIATLLAPGVSPGEAVWADLGSGDGAFTLALRQRLGPDADIYSVDAERARLARQERAFRAGPGTARTHFIAADFTHAMDVPPLDGILMANALHFVEDQVSLLRALRALLRPAGKLLLVEYDITRGSAYVPYPIASTRLAPLMAAAGFTPPTVLATVRSRYWSRIYSALSRA